MERYGEKLVCVRYKQDKQLSRKIKTAEIILHERDCNESARHITYNKIVDVKIECGEIELGKTICCLGWKWNKSKNLWEVPYHEVKSLIPEGRIVW